MTNDPKLLQLAEHFPLNPLRHATWKQHGKGGVYTHDKQPATLELLARHVGMPRADGVKQVTKPMGYLPAIIEADGRAYTNVGMIDLDGKRSDAELEQAKQSLLNLQEAAVGGGFHRATAYEVSHSGKGYHAYIWTPKPIPFEEMAEVLRGWARMAGLPNAETVERFPLNDSALSVWYRMPYANAANDPEGTGRTFLSDIDGEPIPYGELDQYIDASHATEAVIDRLLRAGQAAPADTGDSSTAPADLPGGNLEAFLNAMLNPPDDAFERHDSVIAWLNIGERLKQRDEFLAALQSEAVFKKWVTDGSRTLEQWQKEVDRWAKHKTPEGGHRRGFPFLRAQGFNLPTVPKQNVTLTADPSAEDKAEFDSLLEAAQEATLDSLPSILRGINQLPDTTTRPVQEETVLKALRDSTGSTLASLRKSLALTRGTNGTDEPLSQAAQLLEMAKERITELFHTADGRAFATFDRGTHVVTVPLGSQESKRLLRGIWYEATEGRAIGREPLTEALDTLEAQADNDGPELKTYVRVAEIGGNGPDKRIYIDLQNETRQAIEVMPGTWHVIESKAVPVKFVRSQGMLPLPIPDSTGEVKDVAAALTLDEGTTELQNSIAFLLQTVRGGPQPIALVVAPQGSGKSTYTEHLASLVDPNEAQLRSLPRDTGDLLITAQNKRVLAFDNLSNISAEMSDALCRLSTGGGQSKRKLFTDQDESVIKAINPVVLNSITNAATRPDLVDRAISINLRRLTADKIRTEAEVKADFAKHHAKALGALLNVMADGLTRIGTKHLARKPRMADFAEWIACCAPALGWDMEAWLEEYDGGKTELVRETLDESPITRPLIAVVNRADAETGWSGTPSELLTELNEELEKTHGKRVPKNWPANAAKLTSALQRLAPGLLTAESIEAVRSDTRRNNARTWTLHKVGNLSALSAQQPWTLEKARQGQHNGSADTSESIGTVSAPSARNADRNADSADAVPIPSAPNKPVPDSVSTPSADSADRKPVVGGRADANTHDEVDFS